jgi:hypothetical protein
MIRRSIARFVPTAALAYLAVAPGFLFAAGFTLNCQVSDPATGLVRDAFAPGETMVISYTAEVPPEAADQEINVKLSMRARVGGISIPYALDELKLSLPNQPPVPGEGDLPIEGYFSGSSNVDIPSNFPEGDFTLRAKAAVEGVGKRSCEIKVEIAQPTP